jgi:hypothetical protein
MEGWQKPAGFWPIIAANVTGAPLNISDDLQILDPDRLYVHPGNGFTSESYAVVRWTAPYNSNFSISAEWADLDWNGGDGFGAHVVLDGTSIFDRNPANTEGTSYSDVRTVIGSEVVDFVVDPGPAGNQNFDATSLKITIEDVGSTIPISLTAAVSRRTHGAAGTFDINLPLSGDPGIECRDTAGDYTLVFMFNSDLLMLGDITLKSGTAAIDEDLIFSGATVTMNLTDVADVQTVTFTLSGFTNIYGQTLADTDVSMSVLVGDIDATKKVAKSDFDSVKAEQRQPVDGTNFRNDIDANGVIDRNDGIGVKARRGHKLP